ncbi:TetR/AcrR family transcriptional regulator [Rhodopirellula sp. MGV]|uniref:TetR/AcrR family transcriptional regulator n=1 Tax=Rhodopirellula sp. MGV TaxID=2023130 RepID=UPI000B9704C8|nr:TetR/AcrR family transcriptional regulator [Rhodopirellula sp. MGV]OYP34341.1 hypothetical protein CGZ80_14860 [Rhodopirellula sp. MGV]PNY35257.1 DUF1956 domain-containing protein [Rhodopirellula baltica]
MKKRVSKGRQNNQTEDTTNTRMRLLEAAGQLFAEKGFDRTTSKEITELAGANVASVNYHFQGIEGLYAAVVEEASGLLVTSAQMQEAMQGHQDPNNKLEAFLRMFVRSLTSPASSSWKLRILAREFSSPTLCNQPLHKKERMQKVSILKGIVAEITGLPEEHPAVARSCINVLAPCFFLMIGDRPTIKKAFPKLGLNPKDAEDLVQHMLHYAQAGLAIIAAKANE